MIKRVNDFYKFYKERTNGEKLTSTEVSSICNEYNKSMYQWLMQGKELRFPFGLGSIFIESHETDWSKPPVNWKETRKAGKIVHLTNTETLNKILKFKWSFNQLNTKNIIYYCFKLSFHNKRASAKVFRENGGSLYRPHKKRANDL